MSYYLRCVRLLWVITIFCISLQLEAQLNNAQHRILSGISAYRSELFNRNTSDRQYLGAVIQKQLRNGSSEEDVKSSVLRLGALSQTDPECIPKRLPFIINSDPIFQGLTDVEVRIIIQNADIYDLMSANVLNTVYPYTISAKSRIFEELQFYQINPGDRVAEIGAGNGEFSVIIGVVYDSLELFVNEIEPHKIEYINQKLSRVTSIKPQTLITTVVGEVTNPRLPDGHFNKIILRRSLHHFDNKQEMLNEIRNDLVRGGELLIYEYVRTLTQSSNCYYAMTENHIKRLLKKANFEFVGRWKSGAHRYYRFVSQRDR